MPHDALERIEHLAAGFDGVLGVAAKHFGTGETIRYHAGEIFPTASAFKIVLLYELYRQADMGRIDPATRLTFEDALRVPGSGVLQDFDNGAMLTIKDIATLMIVVSDNTATDWLYDMLGRESVAETLVRLEMLNTHLPLDTWEILAGMHNFDPNDPLLTYQDLKHALRTVEAPWGSEALKETPENDISTPDDMLLLMEKIYQGVGLSEASRDTVIDILMRQKFSERIPALLPFGVKVAHKTGSIKGVRNDVGLVYAGDQVYGVALMSKQATSGIEATRLLADVSKQIFEQFVGPVDEGRG